MVAKRLLVIAALLSGGVAARAHTLRVIPAHPSVEPGRPGTIYLSWGHRLPVDELVREGDLASYELVTPGGSTRPLGRRGTSLQSNAVTFDEPGVYQAVAARNPAVFARYTDAEGRPVFAMTPKDELEAPEGGELLQSSRSRQFAKALVVCGDPGDGDAPAPLGHELELVVEDAPGPGGFGLDEPIRVRVLFRGRPLAGAKVLAMSTTRNPDGSPDESVDADADGVATIEPIEPGTWILEVHHLIDADEADRSKFDTEAYTASLTIAVVDRD